MKFSKKIAARYNVLPTPLKAAIWFTVCSICLRGINAITMPLFTRLLSEDEFGQLSLFQSYQNIILIFATWEMELGAYQKGLFKYKSEEKLFSVSTLALINLITVLCFVFICLFHRHVIEFTGFSVGSLRILFIYLLIFPAYNCWLIRKRTAYQYKSAVAVTLLFSVTSIVFPWLALIWIDKTANIKYQASLLGFLLIGIIFYVSALQNWKMLSDTTRVKVYWHYLIWYSAPLVLHALSYLILAQADRIMIGRMVGKTQVAYYSVAYNVANVMSLLQSSIKQTLVPWYYQMLENKKYDRIKQVTSYLLSGMGMLAFLFVLISPEIIKLLFTQGYYESIWCIPPIVTGIFFMFLYDIFVTVEMYYEKTNYVMYVSAFCAGLNIFLNYFGIKSFGYIACAYTTLFCYILFAIGHAYFMRKTVKNKAGEVSLFNKKFIAFFCGSVTFLCTGMTLLYPYFWIRCVIAVFCIVLILWKKKWIKQQILQVLGERGKVT